MILINSIYFAVYTIYYDHTHTERRGYIENGNQNYGNSMIYL